MARYCYDRLTALDNSFLVLERPNAYMHVASTQTFDATPLLREDGGIDAEAIKTMIAASLHMIPRYRQKLRWIPLQNHPVWVDDDRFNIDFHVRHTALPRPGTDAQLKRLSGRIMQQHLDRQRPLWEMWIVEGLEGDRFALISKVHHCMIDGVSGVDLMRVLMSVKPEYEIPELPAFFPRPAPSGLELLRHEMLRWAWLPYQAATGLTSLVREAQDVRHQAITGVRALLQTLGTSLRPSSETPLNGDIGPHRRFDWLTMQLSDIKSVRKALGGSLNDIVLTVVTGAVRRFLERRQVRPSEIEFRVMAPVSVRSAEERGMLGNRVSAWFIDLPVGESDPIAQLAAIGARTAELKEAKGAVAAEMLTQAAEWTPSLLLSLGGRNVTRWLPFNMVVTNVPGPQVPIYLLGARMLEIFPHVPLVDPLGLGIALMSYDGKLCWGFNADYDLLPDLSAFIKGVRDSFDDLRRCASLKATASSRPRVAATTAGNGHEDPNVEPLAAEQMPTNGVAARTTH